MPSSSPLGPEQLELIARRVSILVASRDASHRAHIARSVGCRVGESARRLTIFLTASTSQSVLADLRANALIAVVFTEPTTHRAMQIKGADALVSPIEPGDEQVVGAYLDRFIAEIGQIGFPSNIAHTILGHAPSDLVAVSFTPQAVFDQTPGPNAGAQVAGAALNQSHPSGK